jgi:hypothetical protein
MRLSNFLKLKRNSETKKQYLRDLYELPVLELSLTMRQRIVPYGYLPELPVFELSLTMRLRIVRVPL